MQFEDLQMLLPNRTWAVFWRSGCLYLKALYETISCNLERFILQARMTALKKWIKYIASSKDKAPSTIMKNLAAVKWSDLPRSVIST